MYKEKLRESFKVYDEIVLKSRFRQLYNATMSANL